MSIMNPPAGQFGKASQHEPVFVQSVARGLAVIRAFRQGKERLTMAQVARACGMTRAGVRRILLTLEDLGYIGQEGHDFHLTPRILELTHGYTPRKLWDVARSHLQTVADELNETVSAGVLEGSHLRYMLRLPSSRVIYVDLEAGTWLPAHISAMGRILLAALPPEELEAYLGQAEFVAFTPHTVADRETLIERLAEARAQGWCRARGEVDEALCCIAVPLADGLGRILAALHVSLSANRADDEAIKHKIVPALQAAAVRISKAI